MCKLSIVLIALVAVVYSHPMPTSEEMQAKLVAAGISTEAAAGIVAIGEEYKSQFEAAKGDKEAVKKVFGEVKAKTDVYIKTQSEADQTAYAAFVEKKKAEFEAREASKSS